MVMLASPRPRRLFAVLTAALLLGACSSSTSQIPVASGVVGDPTVTSEPDEPADLDQDSEPRPTVTPEPAPTEPAPPPVPTRPPHSTTEEPAAEAGTSLADVDASERAWLRSGVVSYRYTFRQSCECDDEQRRPRIVTVSEGRVEEVATDDGEPSPNRGYTAEQLFGAARDSIRRGERVEMNFAANGFPISGILDVEATWVDGGFAYDTQGLEVLAEGPPVDDDYIAALQRWWATGIGSYVMTYRPLCFCPQVDVTVTVADGVVADVETTDTFDLDLEPRTVDELFAEIRRAVNASAHEVTADYHPSDGYPVSFFIDEDPQIADEEHGYEVIAFEAGRGSGVEQPPTSPHEFDAFCEALAAIETIDDPPETAAQARDLLGQMSVYANAALESAPPDLEAGAAAFVRFLEVVSVLAEANDWDPEFFETLDDELLMTLDVDLELVLTFGAATNEHCGF